MAARRPHGAWLLLSGLACFLLLVGSMTGLFVTWWLAPIDADRRPGADEENWLGGILVGSWLGLLSLMVVILIPIGLDQMRLTYPEVGRRTTRRIGPILFTPTWAVALLVLIGVLSFMAGFEPRYLRASFVIGWTALSVLGMVFMIVSAEAMRPLVPRSEDRVIFAAEMAALFGGLLLAGSPVTAFLLGREPSPLLPWASVPAGLSGTFALVLIVRSAWRVARRWEWTPMAPGVTSG
jgi:hypothetical protein